MRLVEFGPAALIAEIDGSYLDVTAAWRVLSRDRPDAVEDVVAGARSVLVRFGPSAPGGHGSDVSARVRVWMTAVLQSLDAGRNESTLPGDDDTPAPAVHTIPVVYDGEDLDEVARRCAMSRGEVVSRHTAAEYTVAFLGFSPGFAYLAGGDPALRVPRRSSPRRRVPAGSVAVADEMSAVYPDATPGGWQLVGRTDATLFDAHRRPPALLAPGDVVRFREVEGFKPRRARAGGEDAASAAASGGTVEVMSAGTLTTMQDRGRLGWAHVGVPRAGAADLASFVLANRAVGNPDSVAALEATVDGPTLRFSDPGALAVRGAVGPVLIDGAPVDPHNKPVAFAAGAVVEFGAFEAGLRSYVAVAGGFRAEEVLGSASRDTLSGLGPTPLAAGAVVGLNRSGLPTGWSPPPSERDPGLRPTPLADSGQPVIVELGPGPRREWIAGHESALFRTWRVGTDSDRAGLRLEGDPVPWSRSEEAAPEGMVAGTVQVPAGGAPIVLMANHGATGGYPSVAVASSQDVARLAQCRPGQEITLVPGPGW